MTDVEILPLRGVPEVVAGDDLAALVLEACERSGIELLDGDVLCVAQKVVSKAEGATAPLPPGGDVHAVRRDVARRLARRVVADTDYVLIVETEHGFVCANAGVDASNVAEGYLTLLPEDPDASAARMRRAIAERAGVDAAVVVTDTFGRPWRLGQTDVAIGVAGIAPLRDERGGSDRQGRTLDVTVVALADEIAAAADLVRQKADGTPFVVVRGLRFAVSEEASARDLVRPAEEDLFRRATLPGDTGS